MTGRTKDERGGTASRLPRVSGGVAGALRLLATCPLLPVDVFAHLSGLRSASGAYKQLARLRAAGLIEVQRADLGYLLGERPLGLWKITELGQRILDNVSADKPCQRAGTHSHKSFKARPRETDLTSLLAAYRLLGLLVAERTSNGELVEVGEWERPWVREVWSPQQRKLLRVRLPAGALLMPRETAADDTVVNGEPMAVVLVPDLG